MENTTIQLNLDKVKLSVLENFASVADKKPKLFGGLTATTPEFFKETRLMFVTPQILEQIKINAFNRRQATKKEQQ
jgi:hypothetical protein